MCDDRDVSTVTERFARVADTFGEIVGAVDEAGAWDAGTPCEGWTARDVVVHLAEWVPGMVGGSGVQLPEGPDPATDPVGAWQHLDRQLRAVLVDPDLAARPFPPPMNEITVETAVERFILGDVMVHTWDLARSIDRDVRLDAEVVAEMAAATEGSIDQMVASGHFATPVDVPPGVEPQAQLLALLGRDPFS